jgi:hypothetical protein
MLLRPDDARAAAVTEAIGSGDVENLERLLPDHPGLDASRIG